VKTRSLVMIVGLCLLTMMTATTRAESLYSEDTYRPLAADKKAFRRGDVVTVLIMEISKAESNADAKARQALELKASLQKTNDEDEGALELGVGRNSSSATQREGELRARISVAVKEIDRNGRLFMRGNQMITVNGEEQTISVSGWARPEDISVQNTILSTRLSDAELKYTGEGEVGDPNERGYIYWLLTKIGLI